VIINAEDLPVKDNCIERIVSFVTYLLTDDMLSAQPELKINGSISQAQYVVYILP
jgi:hypothetical protein